MSRKTLVCAVLAVCLALFVAGLPAQAGPWQPAGSGAATAAWAETTGAVDPDGLTAAKPASPAGFVAHLVRLLLGSLVL